MKILLMKKIITLLCFTISFLGIAQVIQVPDVITPITQTQKQAILNYDYTAYQGNLKTVGDFLLIGVSAGLESVVVFSVQLTTVAKIRSE